MTAAERRVYKAVYERSLLIDDSGMEYPACEWMDPDGNRCRHNGTKWPLQMAHIIGKGRGGKTTKENVRNTCRLHHFKNDHGENIVDSVPMWSRQS